MKEAPLKESETGLVPGGEGWFVLNLRDASWASMPGRGRNAVSTGEGNDVVDAYSRTPATIDCGPGGDRVNIGYNRGVRTVGCETVTRRYKD